MKSLIKECHALFLDILIKIKILASNVVVVTREREGRHGLGNFCMDP